MRRAYNLRPDPAPRPVGKRAERGEGPTAEAGGAAILRYLFHQLLGHLPLHAVTVLESNEVPLAVRLDQYSFVRCGVGPCRVPRPSLADYVRGPTAPRAATAAAAW